MSTQLEILEEEYRSLRRKEGVSSFELVKLEHRLWYTFSTERGKGTTTTCGRREWFHAKFSEEFGGHIFEYEARAAIFNSGPWAYKIFEHIDRGYMKLSLATLVVRQAKLLIRNQHMNHEAALSQAVRSATGINKPFAQSAEHAEVTSHVLPEVSVDFDKSANANSKAFTTRISALASSYIESTFKGVYIDDYHKRRITNDFKDSVGLLVEDLKRTISRVKSATKDDGIEEVGETNFVWACEVLGLSCPFGEPINMRAVKARKNKRSLELHPDRNDNNAAAQKEFQRVQDAYGLLAQYSEKNNRRTT